MCNDVFDNKYLQNINNWNDMTVTVTVTWHDSKIFHFLIVFLTINNTFTFRKSEVTKSISFFKREWFFSSVAQLKTILCTLTTFFKNNAGNLVSILIRVYILICIRRIIFKKVSWCTFIASVILQSKRPYFGEKNCQNKITIFEDLRKIQLL